MQKQRRLLFARNVFLFIIFVCFGVIIVTEKASGLLIPRVKTKMEDYLSSNYAEIQDTLKIDTVTYDKTIYKMKVTNDKNKDHFFYICYSEKKMTDTYKEDYLEGKQLFKKITKNLEKSIRSKTNQSVTVEVISTLDNFTEIVKDRIIKEDNLLELKFYTIKKELPINDWTAKTITTEIIETMNKFIDKNITPKNYTFIITNKEDISESIEISNITEEFIDNKDNRQIIEDIMSDNNSKLVKTNKIKYKFLNEEE